MSASLVNPPDSVIRSSILDSRGSEYTPGLATSPDISATILPLVSVLTAGSLAMISTLGGFESNLPLRKTPIPINPKPAKKTTICHLKEWNIINILAFWLTLSNNEISNMKRLLVLAATVAFLALFSVKEAQASEGQVELRSTRGENARCYAASILMRDLKYRI